MIPENLSEWNTELIQKLIDIKYEEDQKLEYKRVLEDPDKDKKKGYKQKLEEIFCSFANSNGGFIIFGMDDDRSLIGIKIPANQEINLKINQIHSNSIPNILSEAKKINVDGKDLIIVKIHENLDKPVQCSNGSFHIRVSGESLPISRDNLSNWFISKELKKQKYEKLIFEIDLLKSLLIEETNLQTSNTFPPGYKIRTKELQEAISDYHGYFKEGAKEEINRINLKIHEIEKQKNFLDIKIKIALTKGFGSAYSDISSFFSYLKNDFRDTNKVLSDCLENLKSCLDNLKNFI